MEEKTCRICHGGEEVDSKLISPCKCKGTMKYVHLSCLNTWRTMSRNQQSFFRCDQCLYEYSFYRPMYGKLLKNPITLHLLTFLALFTITVATTYLWKLGEILTMEGQYDWSSFFFFDVYQFLGGLSLVGLVGVANLLFLLDIRTGLFVGRSSGRNSIELIIFGIMVFVGLVKAFLFLYRKVEYQTERFLTTAENMIMEVQ